MSFKVEKFTSAPSVEELNTLKKAELLQLVNHYHLTAVSSMPKSQIKQIVLAHLVDEEIIPSSEATEEMVRGERGLTGDEVLQLKSLEFEEREKEREARFRLKELEFKEKELSLQVKLKELEVRSKDCPETVGASFDVSKYVKFIPDFWQTEVDKYFLHFEKVASNLKWPEDNWVLLLQSSLVGKAREVYSALSVEESAQYSVVKSAILKAY